ncbi:MAG: hypothetical protein LBK99_12795 [Opitutaceae bacterium]|jgi:hypothetical protein|nr:hypothetical protein [Opitutaceae bacterium]
MKLQPFDLRLFRHSTGRYPGYFMENDFPSKTIEWPQKGTKGAKKYSSLFLRLLCLFAAIL